MRHILFGLVLSLMLSACSFKSEPVITNEYVSRVKELTAHGLDALHQGRLVSSQQSLEQALKAAWLSDDFVWIGLAQYHLGALYMTQGKTDQAVDLFQRAKKNALITHDQRTLWRSLYALALYSEQTGVVVLDEGLPVLNRDMPADVYISAGRLAQLKHQSDKAKAAYEYVLKLPRANKGRLYEFAQANLGLALLAREQGDSGLTKRYSNEVIKLSQQAGFPMLAAHAHLLQGKMFRDSVQLDNALHMYEALGDKFGQFDALDSLIDVAEEQGNKGAMLHWQQLRESTTQ